MTESESLKRAMYKEMARYQCDTQWSGRFVAEHERLLSLSHQTYGRTAL